MRHRRRPEDVCDWDERRHVDPDPVALPTLPSAGVEGPWSGATSLMPGWRLVVGQPAADPRRIFKVVRAEGADAERLRVEQSQALVEVLSWVARNRSVSGSAEAA